MPGLTSRLHWLPAAALFAIAVVACTTDPNGGGGGNNNNTRDSGTGTNTRPDGGTDDTPPVKPDGGIPTDETAQDDGGVPTPTLDAGVSYDDDDVREENLLPGNPDWMITKPSWQREIEGYADAESVEAGGKLGVAVSLSSSGKWSWKAYRLGYYGGAGAREVARGGPLNGGPQASCPVQRPTGLVACKWTRSIELVTDPTWVRGVYLIKLTRESDKRQAFVPFVVLNRGASPEVIMSLPTGTWQAYNRWGGESLYDDAAKVMPNGHAHQTSYDRPYNQGYGAGQLFKYDLSLVTWLEAQGLDVAYVTTADLDRAPELLTAARAIFLSGHDEYVSGVMRTALDAAVARGAGLLSLGANQLYWQVRFDPAADGRPRRILTGYKEDATRFDPVGSASPEVTVRFRDEPVRRPENALLGTMFARRWNQFAFPYVVGDTRHWAFEGTGLQRGDVLWRTNGYEVDQIVPGLSSPSGMTVLAEAPLLSLVEAYGYGQMVIRQQNGAVIFNAGGNDFVNTLSNPEASDPRAARMVANILYRALGRPVPSTLVEFPAYQHPPPQGPFATAVRTMAGSAGERGALDGPPGTGRLGAPIAVAPFPTGGFATLDAESGTVMRVAGDGTISTPNGPAMTGPMGLAVDAAGNIYVSDTALGAIRVLRPDNTHAVLAGLPGSNGSSDGPGANARFNNPAGLTIGPDGYLYVADMANGTIRKIDLRDPTHPVSTVRASWLYRPSGVAVGLDGTIYVVETGEARVVSIRGGSVEVLAGGAPGYKDGVGDAAQLMPFLGIGVLADGSVAISDPGNYRIRRLVGRTLGTLAGSGKAGHRDGPGMDADFLLPAGLAVGVDGTLYVADAGNGLIRAIVP